MTLKKKPIESIFGKGKNPSNQHFLLFQHIFFFFYTFHDANTFKLDKNLTNLSIMTIQVPFAHAADHVLAVSCVTLDLDLNFAILFHFQATFCAVRYKLFPDNPQSLRKRSFENMLGKFS